MSWAAVNGQKQGVKVQGSNGAVTDQEGTLIWAHEMGSKASEHGGEAGPTRRLKLVFADRNRCDLGSGGTVSQSVALAQWDSKSVLNESQVPR